MEKENVVVRNLVILPSKEIADMAIRASRLLHKEFGSTIILGEEHAALPHITIHQFALPERNLKKLEEQIQTTAKILTAGIEVHMDTCILYSDGGIWWKLGNINSYWEAHRAFVSSINPVREHYCLPNWVDILTGEIPAPAYERRSLALWGSPWADPEPDLSRPFHPHITLGKIPDDFNQHAALKAVINIVKRSPRFVSEKVYLTEVGPNGTCPGIINEFSLGI